MRIGIDFGGTKIEAVALDQAGDIICRKRIASPRGDYTGSLQAIAGLVHQIEAELGESGTVGVGIPGAVSPASGLVKNANSQWLIGTALEQDLARLLDRPVRLANDADCFAVSEASDGAAAGAASMFGIIIGTGCGGGIMIGGSLLRGPNAIAGEWGHNPLPWPSQNPTDGEFPGRECYCGRRGCIETFLSGPGMAAGHFARHGTELQPEEIAHRADSGDVTASDTIARYADQMARATAALINVLDPEIIVLGGGMSHIEQLYVRVPQLWPRYVFSDRVDTKFARALHGDSSGVRGAAWLWPQT